MNFQGENFRKVIECKWTKFTQPLIFRGFERDKNFDE